MSITQELAPPAVRWDLSALFSGIDDPQIAATWDRASARAKDLAELYRGKINSPDLTAQRLAEGLRELENLYQDVVKPINFAHLLHSCDAASPEIGAFLQKQMEKGTAINVELLFFELELQAIPQETIEAILGDPALDNYRHYIQVARAFSPHRLSEPEEVLLEETANTGSRAWVRLFEEVTSNQVFKLRRPGSDKVEEMSQSEVLALLRDPNRELRQAAADALSAGLAEIQRVTTFTYNNLLQDKNVEDRLRKFEYPEQARHMANELSRPVVDLVMRLCREHYGLVARFYEVKRRILGLPELTHIDRYAPLHEATEKVEWQKARRIVLEAFGGFNAQMAELADEFFEHNWIDAEPRPGKRGGAFCAYNTPDTHPVIFQSYLNKMDDVMTLAHELGHGVHSSLSREQTYFNYHGTLPLAELASTFGEMLVFERITADASLEDRLALYAEKIEGVFATVFRQAAMYSFEQECHRRRRAEGELSAEDFGDLWHAKIQEMFGDSVKLGEQHRAWWSYVGHFIHTPFYVYAYSFGELLVLSLYQMAKAEGPAFADKYVAMLKMGGSRSPADLMATVGVDLESESFWRGGFDAMEKLVSEFERLAALRGGQA